VTPLWISGIRKSRALSTAIPPLDFRNPEIRRLLDLSSGREPFVEARAAHDLRLELVPVALSFVQRSSGDGKATSHDDARVAEVARR
jgi:hypothetical protein